MSIVKKCSWRSEILLRPQDVMMPWAVNDDTCFHYTSMCDNVWTSAALSSNARLFSQRRLRAAGLPAFCDAAAPRVVRDHGVQSRSVYGAHIAHIATCIAVRSLTLHIRMTRSRMRRGTLRDTKLTLFSNKFLIASSDSHTWPCINRVEPLWFFLSCFIYQKFLKVKNLN